MKTMKKYMFLTTIIVLLLATFTNAQILFESGFENGPTDGGKWVPTSSNGAYLYTSSDAREGNSSVRFITHPTGKRNEMVLPNTNGDYDWGKEYWVGFSMKILQWPAEGNRILSQHHASPTGSNGFTINVKDASKFWILTSTQAGSVDLNPGSAATQRVDYSGEISYQINQWMDFVLHFRYALDNTGFFEVWMNGTKIVERLNTPTTYKYDRDGALRNTWNMQKIGIYHGNGVTNGGEILYDAFRIAGPNSNYNDVMPGGGGGPTLPGLANTPNPSDGGTSVSISSNLSWNAGSGATSHDVYFGTSSPPAFVTNQTVTSYNPGTLANNTTYYWRIDEVNSQGTTTGTEWSFTTESGATGNILLNEDFTYNNGALPSGWWSEGNAAEIKDGRLYVNGIGGNGVSTIWYNQEYTGDLRIEYDVYVNSSSNDANNINFFFLYSDPSGIPLYDTRNDRADGAYSKYHNMNGYIATYVNDPNSSGVSPARFRLRVPPNFDNMIDETFNYTSAINVLRHIVIERIGDRITYAVDGTIYLDAINNQHNSGLIGFRTYHTELWWDNLKITDLDATSPTLPGPANTPNPVDGGTSVGISSVLNWNAGSGSTSHDVYFGTSSFPAFVGNQSGTSYAPGTLANSTTYYWRIDEVNNAGTTTGTEWSFTTEAAPTGGTVTLEAEDGSGTANFANNYAGYSGTGFVYADENDYVEWTVSASSGTQTLTFRYGCNGTKTADIRVNGNLVASALSFSSGGRGNWAEDVSVDVNLISGINTIRLTKLLANGALDIDYAQLSGGTTPQLPTQATNPNPANGATDLSISSTLNWTAGSGAESHNVYFGTSSPPASVGNQTGTNYNSGTLTNSTTYYWRIDEVNSAGTTTGTEWSFTTEAAGQPVTTIYEGELLTISTSSGDNTMIVDNTEVSNGQYFLQFSDAVGDYVTFDVDVAQAGTYTISIDFWSHTARGTIQLSVNGTDVGLPVDEYRSTQSLVTGVVIGEYTFPSAGTYAFKFTNVQRNGSSTSEKFAIDLIKIETVGTPLPGIASNPNPTNGAVAVDTSANLSWTAGSGSVSHNVYFGTSSPPVSKGNQAGATYDPGTLAFSTTYYWRIDEVNATGTTTGTEWSFTTIAEPTGGVVTLEAEDGSGTANFANNYAGYSGTGFVYADENDYVEWSVSASSGTQTLTFRYGCNGTKTADIRVNGNLVASTLSFSSGGRGNWAEDVSVDVNLISGTNTIRLTKLLANGALDIDYAQLSGGTTPQLPTQATNPNPANGTTDLSISTTLNWTAGSGVESHNVYFGTSSPPASVGNQTGTNYNPGTLTNSTTYYWRIDEVNSAGTTTGTEWSFTTKAPTTGPIILEAEDGSGTPNFANNYTGYSGTGFIYLDENNYIEWTVTTSAGSKTLAFRFGCNGTKTADIRVNGVIVANSLSFNSGGRGNWSENVSVNANFVSGNNTIRITKLTANGALDIDYLKIQDVLSKNSEDSELENEVPIIPEEFAIANYPNPFNPSTNIQYDLPENGFIVLTIYDITGKKVIELVREDKSAGSYKVAWDAKDSYGQAVSTGIYLYRINYNEQVKTSKMIYLK